jgi:hypothetical protein
MKRAWALMVLFSCALAMNASSQLLQQGGKLVGTGAVGVARQGTSVFLSSDGNTAIVGGYSDNNFAGASWVFAQSGGVWTQQGTRLVGAGAVGNSYQGIVVSLSSDGNTAIVGGYGDNGGAGAAWIFARTAGVWTQRGAKLLGTGAVGSPSQGRAVSLSGDGNTAIVGGSGDNGNAGAAWIFIRSGGVWTQQGTKLVGTGAVGAGYQAYSASLSYDGNTAIVGGIADSGNTGAAWVFTRTGGVWTQQGKKLVGTGAVGSSYQGVAVSLSSDGNTALVGGHLDNGSAGATWVFTRSGGVWTQQGTKLVGTGSVGAASQGCSVSLSADGNTAIVGGYADNGYAGAAWVFTRSGGVWTQQGTKRVATGAVGAANQGYSVALSGEGKTAIVGGNLDNSAAGAAWMYIDAQPSVAAVKDLPFDQGGTVAVSWNKSRGDVPPSTIVTEYWVWRGIRVESAPGGVTALSREDYVGKASKNEAGDLTFMTTRTKEGSTLLGGDIYWQYVTSLPSHGLAHYSYACPTFADSTPQGIPWRYFFITATTGNPEIYWDSPPDSGYSVDNISPRAPANAVLASLANGRIRLAWSHDRSDPDVGHYAVYRSTTGGFPTADSTRLQTTTDSTAVDSSTSAGEQYYYRITTVDVHGNESIPTPELGITISALPGISGADLPDEFGLSQNFPNPFNPSTMIRYALPARTLVRLTVFNMLGQQVALLQNGEQEAGRHDVRFDAQGLPSGLYFYRLQVRPSESVSGRDSRDGAGSYTDTKKLLIIR